MIKKYRFRSQLTLVFTFGIILLSISTTLLISHVFNIAMRERIMSEGIKLTQAIAEKSTLALLYESKENASEAVGIFASFPDVVNISIINTELLKIYGLLDGNNHSLTEIDRPSEVKLYRETDTCWIFVSPVLVDNEVDSKSLFFGDDVAEEKQTIGFVEVTLTKNTLSKITTDIFLSNILLSTALAFALLTALLFFSHRLTRPVHGLAETMRLSAKGERHLRAKLDGPKDIIEMQIAFNGMMDELENRELQLELARDQAYESSRIKTTFVANVSHELRTPMNSILGILEILSDYDISDNQQRYLNIAKKSGQSLLLLIDDVLSFSKGEAKSLDVEKIKFSIDLELSEIISLLGSNLEDTGLSLTYVIGSNVPGNVVGDSHKIRQVLINLISNAIKFTTQGSVFVGVDYIKRTADEVFLQFKVVDTGIGIKKNHQDRIFSAFTQADTSTTRKFGGTGLGLSISHQIVGALSGEFEVESEYGKGSTFRFCIPLGIDEKQPSHVYLPLKKHALLVIDDKLLRQSIESFCEAIKLDFDVVTSEKQATHVLSNDAESKIFDLVIIDAAIIEEDTSSLLHLLSKDSLWQRYKTLLLGGIAESDELQPNPNNGFCIAKPIVLSRFHEKIERLFGVNLNSSVESERREKVSTESLANFENCSFSGSKVLLVEDNKVNQIVFAGLMKPFECDLWMANNGLEGVSKSADIEYDLIFMDCSMPEMDGYEATRVIRLRDDGKKRIPIVAITANVSDEDSEKCISCGMDEYLPKPLSRSDLYDVLIKYLAPIQTPNSNHSCTPSEQPQKSNIVSTQTTEKNIKPVDE